MDARDDDPRRWNPPRPLSRAEQLLVEQLLGQPFEGSEAIRAQLAAARVEADGHGDTRTICLTTDRALAPVPVALRIPVEGEAQDEDGVAIPVLLHVVDGYVQELEIYRVDGKAILSDEVSELGRVLINVVA